MTLTTRCKDFEAYLFKEDNKIYLIITCKSRRGLKVRKCFDLFVNNDKLSVDSTATLTFVEAIDVNVLMRGLQSFGTWLSKRYEEKRAKVGYVGEMIIKHAAYMLCKHRGELVKCLKECKITTRKGEIGWKAVYQMFVNSKDLPREEEDVKMWKDPLPVVCTSSDASAGAS
jgi:hypothetical protein